MQTVKLHRDHLLQKLQANREQHVADYEAACQNYRTKAGIEMRTNLERLLAGEKIVRCISVPEPEEHTAEYDRVIAMLKMSVDEFITLTAAEFSTYVLDQWNWQASFSRTTKSYIG